MQSRMYVWGTKEGNWILTLSEPYQAECCLPDIRNILKMVLLLLLLLVLLLLLLLLLLLIFRPDIWSWLTGRKTPSYLLTVITSTVVLIVLLLLILLVLLVLLPDDGYTL